MNANGLGAKNFIDMYSPPANILPLHQMNGNKSHHQQQQQPQHNAYSAPYSSGPHLSSQTPYGPHVPAAPAPSSTNGTSTSTTPGGPPGLAPPATTSTANPSSSSANTEEISTIFVVGFPEDMQEREFQNMFTFSPDFEAATLKIPNKEYTAYGGIIGGGPAGSAALRNGYSGFGGSNDPYNLVTLNQGGVVVDGGRDGTMASWPANVPTDDINGVPFLGGALSGGNVPGLNMPPRKQIIGFAKFKTRDAALQARDGLQGRRVDIDKGAVLKAEMAKKNLHTKRGVGPVPGGTTAGPTNAAGAGGPGGGSVAGGLQQALTNGATPGAGGAELYLGNEAMGTRDREIGSLGVVGLGNGRLTQWRDQMQQHDHIHPTGSNGIAVPDREDDDRRGMIGAMGLNSFGSATRGPRERAEEDERERRRKGLRAGNSNAYDAFHSVPPGPVPLAQSSRHMSNHTGIGMLSPAENEAGTGTSPIPNGVLGARPAQQQHEELPGPWDNVRSRGGLGPRPRSSSQRSTSPPLHVNGHVFDMPPRSFTPPEHHQFLEQSRHDPHYTDVRNNHASSESSSSSVVGGPQSFGHSGGSDGHVTDAEMSRALGGLDVNVEGGKTSPQLPSPASGASSRNGVDQNPPINTLYVGNLPTSPPPSGFPQDYLEESLRELFNVRAGFRRLCFRHKSNGPMCFVEFEDVPYATKALNDLYGNTLKGLVKGGIRLSYSKNPLGVRTPTSAGSGPSLQQQQQQIPSVAPNNSYTSPVVPDFQPRSEEQQSRTAPMILRRDMALTSPLPQVGHQSFAPDLLASSPPPPRFFSSSPSGFSVSAGSTSLTGTSNSFVPRYGFAMPSSSSHAQSSTFSPFGLSNTPPPHSTIPDNQMNSDGHLSSSHSQHFHHNFAPANNLEAARAG